MNRSSLNVLFLCTGNSARSILAEATLNHLAGESGELRGYSAGSYPKGQPNPLALALLEREGIPTSGLRSKSWDEFTQAGAPRLDLVVTVCDQAAGEQCPLYAGAPLKVHWGVPDPHTAQDFDRAYEGLRRRIEALVTLAGTTEDLKSAKTRLIEIGSL